MRKLKKSLNNKKPIVFFIYGPMAVGKLTVGSILSKKIGFKLSHNHMLNDLVNELLARSTYESHLLKEKLRYELYATAVKYKVNFIITHSYTHNWVSLTGLSDPRYVETLEKKLTKLGAEFYGVHLQANNKELLKRVNMNSRKAFKKLRDKKIMREFLLEKDWKGSPNIKNNLVIDNTKLSPEKVSNIIIKHYKLK